ncbi:MAG: response regulator [Actinomycetota bacterium]|nr:response regulator [Actinomycetota bacterium]
MAEDNAAPVILAVDDEPVNLDFLTAVLEPEGYRMLCAENGERALEILADTDVDLVLLDILMPGLDGVEVCKRLKRGPRGAFTPIIMVTALDSIRDRVRAIEAGADDFLCKPINRQELLARTMSLLRIKSYHDGMEGAYRSMSTITSMSADFLKKTGELEMIPGDIERELATSFMVSTTPRNGPRMLFTGSKEPRGGARGVLLDNRSRLIKIESRAYRAIDLETMGIPWERMREPTAVSSEITSGVFLAVDTVEDTAWVSDGESLVLAWGYPSNISSFDQEALKTFFLNFSFFRSLSNRMRETEEAFRYTIEALARAAEVNDDYTGEHIYRVDLYSALLAEETGLPSSEAELIGYSAQMHDVGKIHIHPDILGKTGALTGEEWEIMKSHTWAGKRILGDHPRLSLAADIALNHHEKWDGSGYPRGLKGEEIPLAGRIVAICDVYDALRSPRSYKEGFGHARAVEIITRGDRRSEPSHFDPRLLEAFRRRNSDFAAIYDQHSA